MFKWFTVDIWDPVWKDYEEKTILDNPDEFMNNIFSKSLFDKKKDEIMSV